MSQYHHISDNTNSFNNINYVWNNCTVADEKSEILAWLSPLEPQIRHHDIRTRRVDQVGDWLLQTEEYRSWFGGMPGGKSNGSALFCYGGPGVGKTYISSLVIDTLCKQAVGANATVACFYFDFAAQEEQSSAAVLGSVLKQVVGGLEEVPERIVKAFRDRGRVIGGQRLSLAEIVEFLQDISSSRSTYICIDALDECPPAHQVNLLDSLNQILQMSPGARIFLTGRPHIRGEVDKHLARRAATRSITPTRSDVITFLRAKLKEDTMPDAMDESLEEEIMQNIPETVSEIFLLVFLSIKAILQEPTIYRRRQKLSAMKNGLDLGDAYKATVGRIKSQEGEKDRLGMAVLMWISHSRRPLQVDEICHAIAIQIASNDLNSDDIPAISTLLGCCQGLVTMDKGSSTVRLIHFTLHEYLYANPDLFDKAHSTMAETCLAYLNFKQVKNLSAAPSSDPRDTPFLEYSSLHWGTHMRMEFSNRAKTFALELLSQFDSHISAKSLWKSINGGLPFDYYPGDKPFSALHCISYFGVAEVANTLINMNRWDVNQRDGAGMTPLIWAARYGREEVVRLLLREKYIQPDQKDANSDRTPLSWAAGNGHEGVVRLFLEPRFVNPASIGRRWGKAVRVVDHLFGGRYVDPNSSSKYGKTPLLWAVESGHEGVVELFLGHRSVNPNTPDTEYGQTPLSWAAKKGNQGIVKLLVGRKDVNPDTPDTMYGQTPLSWAARNGHEGVVKLLLGREDANPDTPDTVFGQSPLLWAAKKGHQGIVRLLLERGGVGPDTPDTMYGRTPLSWAAKNGHEGIVKLLLEREGVNPDIRDTDCGRTPLLWAAEKGHEGVVKLLLGQGDVNIDTPDTEYGLTPLSSAAVNGHEGIVKLLLEQKNVHPNILSKSGGTPLSLAAGNGHLGIVELLLGREDVSPDIPDTESGQTLLLWAAEQGHEGVAKLLLERRNASANGLGKYGEISLSSAAENGHVGIVKLLLGREDVNPDIPDRTYGQTPLSWAAENGHEAIVKLLLWRKNVNPNSLSKSGRTPLSWATGNGHEGVTKLLLEWEVVNPNVPDTVNGRTPLSWAAGNGHEGIVKLLLGCGDVNPDIPDTLDSRTPLWWAVENGHRGVVKLLLKNVRPNGSNKFGEIPLALTAGNGHDMVAKPPQA